MCVLVYISPHIYTYDKYEYPGLGRTSPEHPDELKTSLMPGSGGACL